MYRAIYFDFQLIKFQNDRRV